jgi:hypothetical protein
MGGRPGSIPHTGPDGHRIVTDDLGQSGSGMETCGHPEIGSEGQIVTTDGCGHVAWDGHVICDGHTTSD